MPKKKPTTCSSCGAAIIFAKAAKSGKPHPLDAEPTTAVVGVIDGEGQVHFGRGRPSHFSTCPDAPQHRRRGASS